MRPLRYSINVTLDGCVDHQAGPPADEYVHAHATRMVGEADALILGRITYELMEFWRAPSESGVKPEGMPDWMMAFARAIGPKKKYVVSSTFESTGWNAEPIRGGDLESTIRRLKAEPGNGLYVGGVTLPRALAELGLIDRYELMVLPWIAGRGPSLFNGLSAPLDLRLVGREEFPSGAVAVSYEPRRPA